MAYMAKRTSSLTSVLLALLVAARVEARTPGAESTPIEVSWSNVGILIQGHKIQTALTTGAVVEGKVRSVGPDSMDLQVTKTSDETIQPKGDLVIPRPSLHRLKLLKPQKKWRIILTSVGAGVAIPLWALGEYSYNEGGGGAPPSLGASMAIGGAAGYLGGWALDRKHDVTITIP